MKKLLLTSLILQLMISINPTDTIASDLSKSITSSKPARTWEDAMLSGNGLIGTMQYGDPTNETVIFNCHKFILPNGSPFEIPDLTDHVEKTQQLMLNGQIGEGWKHYYIEYLKTQGLEYDENDRYRGLKWPQTYHPGYKMNINIPPTGEISNYSRTTDYQTGQIIIKWTDDTGEWTHKSFASRRDNAIVSQITLPDPQKASCTISVSPAEESPENIEYTTITDNNTINFRGKYPAFNGKQAGFEGVTRIITDGKITIKDKATVITEASNITLITALDRYKDDFSKWDNKLLQLRLQATPASYSQLFSRHVAIHKEMFNRVEFSLFANDANMHQSTEALLRTEGHNTNQINTALLEKLFYTSRYLYMASSGSKYAPRLTGIFIGQWGAAWADDYTCDSNVNMAVFGGGIANLPECMEGYFSILERTQGQWRSAAKKIYNCRGILGPVRIDGEYALHLQIASYHAHIAATGIGPWLIYPMYEHYQITGDKEFLAKRLYPLLVQQALFYQDFLAHKDKNGDYIFVPSCSPENGSPDVTPRASAAINSTFDISACKHALKMLIESEKALGIAENDITRSAKDILKNLPPYLLTKDGALKEWSHPELSDNFNHRHSSHLYVVWPAYEISPENPETSHLVTAVSRAIAKRPQKINETHGTIQNSIGWLRTKNAQQFYKQLQYVLENNYFYTSLASSCRRDRNIYNYDFICSLQGMLIEMCIFTDSGVIELLPAMPEQFTTGKINGIKGRNQTTINELEWDLKKGIIKCSITSDIDQELKLIHRKGIKAITSNAKIDDTETAYIKTVHLAKAKPAVFEIRINK